MNWKFNDILTKDYLKENYIRRGLRQGEIARNNKCSVPTVTRYIKEHKINELRDRYIRFLYNLGLRHTEIQEYVKRDQPSISRILMKMGIDGKSRIQERMNETIQQIYGVDNVQKNYNVQQKRIKTCLDRYGVESPLYHHNAHLTGKWKDIEKDVLKKSRKSFRSTKEYTLPSGDVINIQGYENFAIDILLKSYDEHDFEFDNIPVIKYYSGKNRRHYPDIFIPKDNLIIEVKSTYTMRITKNLFEKMRAAKELGYDYRIWVIDKGQLLEEISKPATKN